MDDYKTPNYMDVREYKADQLQQFLKKIAELESNSGQNTEHVPMKAGMHKGTAAVGNYGLMPLTAQDLDRQYSVNELQNMPKEDVQKKLEQNPELQKRLAETLASKLLKNNPEDVAAHKWLYGQYSKPTPKELEKSERIRKFRVLSNAK
jgi:hypothetical protein